MGWLVSKGYVLIVPASNDEAMAKLTTNQLSEPGAPKTTLTSRKVPMDQTVTTGEESPARLDLIFGFGVEAITGISGAKSHMQVTCVRSRLRLTRKMDGRGEIKSNWKFRGLNWEFFKFMRYFKTGESSWEFCKVFPKN